MNLEGLTIVGNAKKQKLVVPLVEALPNTTIEGISPYGHCEVKQVGDVIEIASTSITSRDALVVNVPNDAKDVHYKSGAIEFSYENTKYRITNLMG